ncbi:hypothetical protein [Streptomyces ureilyticus]|uniref:Uncharacterized protein n=1 Tax=Streptomyces ureilyticus TaxID=1775131 RepID=A0ABX0E6J5_9ACTN|nr:hypothetical protein [Streptomyces ureilyticus]NGO49019.1 hypothetical protein [Streptomyces ureilyticus]
MRTQEVLQRLPARDEAYHREWKNGDLKEFLEGFDAEPHKSEGVMVVERKKVVDALASRDAA